MGQRIKLPPLKALQAFNSAAAHLNFTKAAEELCVTAAAVSYQVRLLERALGAPLFKRLPRALELTREGKSIQAVCERAFGDIAKVVEAVRSESANMDIRVASVPVYSAKVLFPARQEFMGQFKKFNLIINHTLDAPDFSEDGFDFAILFGKGSWPGLRSDLLFHSPTGPACAPAIVQNYRLENIDDLTRIPILLDHACFHDLWVDWFAANKVNGWERLSFVVCNDIYALVLAATQGIGLVMEPDFVLHEQLKDGSLVRPFEISMSEYGYYLVYPLDTLNKASCKSFREWLITRHGQIQHQ